MLSTSLRLSVATKTARRARNGAAQTNGRARYIELDPEYTETWRLDAVVDLIKGGGVGIIPTDSFPSFVCDLGNRGAVQKLYELKQITASKPLSILCRNLQDVSTYTLGFPVSRTPGQPDVFKIAKRVLPGPYTFILHASKELPKQVTNFTSGRSKQRTTVGVRVPDCPVCQYILEQLDRPLLCSTAKGEDGEALPDAAVLVDLYGPRGLDFIVDTGFGGSRDVEETTVLDLTGVEPLLVREGKGDASLFVGSE
ncbi:hypothetical protein N2152v2_007511 [Parachlorella kessleri]